LREEISKSGDINGFWDRQQSTNGKTVKRPKREPDISPQIARRLGDITFRKNISFREEVQLGNGKLDLLASAPLADGSIAEVCIEMKEAHSPSLAHGLTIQLPEYMRRVETDYGIYCVLNFGSDYPCDAEQFIKLGIQLSAETCSRIDALIGVVAHSLEIPIKIVIVDLFAPPTPSKM
jgi:hypothetical protein